MKKLFKNVINGASTMLKEVTANETITFSLGVLFVALILLLVMSTTGCGSPTSIPPEVPSSAWPSAESDYPIEMMITGNHVEFGDSITVIRFDDLEYRIHPEYINQNPEYNYDSFSVYYTEDGYGSNQGFYGSGYFWYWTNGYSPSNGSCTKTFEDASGNSWELDIECLVLDQGNGDFMLYIDKPVLL